MQNDMQQERIQTVTFCRKTIHLGHLILLSYILMNVVAPTDTCQFFSSEIIIEGANVKRLFTVLVVEC
jgi:hypothetical protein